MENQNGNFRWFNVHGKHVQFWTNDDMAREWLDAVGHYEPEATKLLVDLLDADSVFVDVGAWIGWYSVIAAQFCREVYAFEMNHLAYQQLLANCRLNQSRASVVPELLAVWDKADVVQYKAEKRPGVGVNGKGAHAVQSIMLDHYFPNRARPDVVKVDVEGAEAKVLAGMTEILDAGVHLIMEVHKDKMEGYDAGSAEDLIDTLASSGYETRYVENGAEVDPCCLPRNFKVHARPA